MEKKKNNQTELDQQDKPDLGQLDQQDKPVSLVRMVRPEELGEPSVADVHPDEVENYRCGGWEIEK